MESRDVKITLKYQVQCCRLNNNNNNMYKKLLEWIIIVILIRCICIFIGIYSAGNNMSLKRLTTTAF